MSPEVSEAGQINRNTLIPIGVAVGMLVSVVSLTLWLGGKFSDLEHSIQMMQVDLQRMQIQLERSAMQSWTRDQQASWVALLKAQNRDLVVPEVR